MKLKVIAGVLSLPLGKLTKRDKAYQLQQAQRRARTLYKWLGALLAVAIVAIAAGILALLNQRRAEARRLEVVATLAASDFQQGSRLLDEPETVPQGLALLARAVRQGAHQAAASRSWTLLQQRSFWIPVKADPARGEVDTTESVPPSIANKFSALNLRGHTYKPDSIGISENGMTVVTVISGDPILKNIPSAVRVWSVDGSPITPWLSVSYSGHRYLSSIRGARLAPDGEILAVVADPFREPDYVELWDVYHAKRIGQPIQASGRVPQFQDIEFSQIRFFSLPETLETQGGSLLLIASLKGDAKVYLVDPARSRYDELARSQHRTGVTAATVDAKREWLMSGSEDGEIRVSSLKDGVEIGTLIATHIPIRSLERIGPNSVLVTFVTGTRQTFELVSPLAPALSKTLTAPTRHSECLEWDPGPLPDPTYSPDSSQPMVLRHERSGITVKWTDKRRLDLQLRSRGQRRTLSRTFATDLSVICLAQSGSRIMTTDRDFITELWTNDLNDRAGPPLDERTLFQPGGETADKPREVVLSAANDIALTRSSFFDPPNLMHIWITAWDVGTGLPLTDRVHFADDGLSGPSVGTAMLDASDRYILYVTDSADRLLSALQVRPAPRVLAWLPDVIEAIGGLEMSPQGVRALAGSVRVSRLERLLPLVRRELDEK